MIMRRCSFTYVYLSNIKLWRTACLPKYLVHVRALGYY